MESIKAIDLLPLSEEDKALVQERASQLAAAAGVGFKVLYAGEVEVVLRVVQYGVIDERIFTSKELAAMGGSLFEGLSKAQVVRKRAIVFGAVPKQHGRSIKKRAK